MSVKTKLITIPTTLALLAILAVWHSSNLDPAARADDNYVLSVKWEPGVLTIQQQVKIVVTVDGHPFVTRMRHVSPYGETMTAGPGAVVVLTAYTANPNTQFMDCIIMRNGKSIPGGGYDSIPGPGAVRCQS